MSTRTITPDEALELTAPTDGFLCPLSTNVYGIDFLEFEIKDYDSGEHFPRACDVFPRRSLDATLGRLALERLASGAVSRLSPPCASLPSFLRLLVV